MKIRVISVVFGVIAMLGLGTAPVSAAANDACPSPILYPYCG